MRHIRFSHADYDKFVRMERRSPFRARLLQVFLLQDEDVSDPFKEYDTKYYVENNVQYYPLNSRVFLVLLLETEDGFLFTTMRPATPTKLQFYRDAQGEQFEIVFSGRNEHAQ